MSESAAVEEFFDYILPYRYRYEKSDWTYEYLDDSLFADRTDLPPVLPTSFEIDLDTGITVTGDQTTSFSGEEPMPKYYITVADEDTQDKYKFKSDWETVEELGAYIISEGLGNAARLRDLIGTHALLTLTKKMAHKNSPLQGINEETIDDLLKLVEKVEDEYLVLDVDDMYKEIQEMGSVSVGSVSLANEEENLDIAMDFALIHGTPLPVYDFLLERSTQLPDELFNKISKLRDETAELPSNLLTPEFLSLLLPALCK